MPPQAQRYDGFKPASAGASACARGASRKTDTKPEVRLRNALWRAGLRYRKNRVDLPGKPDIVFSRAKLVLFVDGDFWHGKNWSSLKSKLERGHNPEYWVNKIHGNITRDERRSRELRSDGWEVVRVWESDVINDLVRVVERIKAAKARCELSPDACSDQVAPVSSPP